MQYILHSTTPDGREAIALKLSRKAADDAAKIGRAEYPNCLWLVKLVMPYVDRNGVRVVHTIH